MAGRQPDWLTSVRAARGTAPIRLFGRLCGRAGLLLGAPSLLVLLGSASVLAAGSIPATASRFLEIVGAAPPTLSGVEIAFYAAALGLLAACWLLGLGLLIDGIFEESG